MYFNRQVPLLCWVELPTSRFGIEYVLPKPVMTPRLGGGGGDDQDDSNSKNLFTRNFKWKQKSPFEAMLELLNYVTMRYPKDTAILYIREIFEPQDSEYGFLDPTVAASRLSQEQVDRLRIMILPQRREEILVAYLDHYKEVAGSNNNKYNNNVIQNFSGFQRRYSCCKNLKEKVDLLFGFSFAIQRYSSWMYVTTTDDSSNDDNNKSDRENVVMKIRSIEKMVAALARHWRNLFMKKSSPEELGLDREFSYPAVFSFLESFKLQVESIDTKGLPAFKFVFESSTSSPRSIADGNSASFDEESSISTITTGTSSSRS